MCSLNLLIVDEDGVSAEATANRLRGKGFVANYVGSGTDALKLFEKEKSIDVVIIVARTSEHEGIATLEQFGDLFPLVEIIMLSANATVPSAIEAMKMGAFDYLNTTCDFELLIGRVVEAGARKRQRESEILDIRMQPYLTEGVRRAKIAEVLGRRV